MPQAELLANFQATVVEDTTFGTLGYTQVFGTPLGKATSRSWWHLSAEQPEPRRLLLITVTQSCLPLTEGIHSTGSKRWGCRCSCC